MFVTLKGCVSSSIIAQKIKCGHTDLSYIIIFWLALYFKELLLVELQESPCFIVSFDESLNQELQQEQIDSIINYFKEDIVAYRYLTSTFLGHTWAEDLEPKFGEGTQDLKMRKMIWISMHGSNVNLKLYES